VASVQWFSRNSEAIVERPTFQSVKNNSCIARTVSWLVYFDSDFWTLSFYLSKSVTAYQCIALVEQSLSNPALTPKLRAASARFGVNSISKYDTALLRISLEAGVPLGRRYQRLGFSWLFPPIHLQHRSSTVGSSGPLIFAFLDLKKISRRWEKVSTDFVATKTFYL